MATNWTVVADQDSVDQVSAKIGESTDNESKQTVFGKLNWTKKWLADKLDMKISDIQCSSIKKVQRGMASVAATITIDAVDINKTFVVCVSKGSAGYVAARGVESLSGTLLPTPPNCSNRGYSYSPDGSAFRTIDYVPAMTGTFSGAISGGTTDLTTKQYSAKLISATQIQTDGPCEWQVIEFM